MAAETHLGFTNFTEIAGIPLPLTQPDIEERLHGKNDATEHEPQVCPSSFHHKFWIGSEDGYSIVAYRERGSFYKPDNPVGNIKHNLHELLPDRQAIDPRLPVIARYFGIRVATTIKAQDTGQSVREFYAALPGIAIIQQKREELNRRLPEERQIIDFEPYSGGGFSLAAYFDALQRDTLPLSNGEHPNKPTYGELYAVHDMTHLIAVTGVSKLLRGAVRRAIGRSIEKDANDSRLPTYWQRETGHSIDGAFTIEGVSQVTLPRGQWNTLQARDRHYWYKALGVDLHSGRTQEEFEPFRLDVSRQLDAVIDAVRAIGQAGA